MKARNVFGLILAVVLLLVVAGSGLAREPQPMGPTYSTSAHSISIANAPWFRTAIDTPGDTGLFTSVAINRSTGYTYASYYDETNHSLRMAQFKGPGPDCDPKDDWSCRTIDSGGRYSSIAINPVNGWIGIAYQDYSGDMVMLKYAYRTCAPLCSWSKHIIDQVDYMNSITGKHISLKFHSDGTPSIAYHEDYSGFMDRLKVASPVGSGGNCGYGAAAGKWQCDGIQTGYDVGEFASLALDGAGNRHIAYYDGANGDLWIASDRTGANCGPGNSWICYPVDSANDVGKYASLYVDKNNDFHIAYYDATADKLKYAVNKGSGGNCGIFGSAQCDTIDDMPTGYHWLGVSIAEDAAGYPIIAYQDKYGSLNVARPLGALGLIPGSGNCGPANPFATWRCSTVHRYYQIVGARHGDYVSVDLNSAGLASIAYYGSISFSGGNLMVAYQQLQVNLPLVKKNQ